MLQLTQPYNNLTKARGVIELLFNDHTTPGVIYIVEASQTLSGSYTEIKRFHSNYGFVDQNSVKQAAQEICGAARKKGCSFIFAPATYSLDVDHTFYLKVTKLTPQRYAGAALAGSITGANTFVGPGKDFAALGVVATDTLLVGEGLGTVITTYPIAAALGTLITTSGAPALPAPSLNNTYQVYETETYSEAIYMVTDSLIGRTAAPVLLVQGTAPNGATIADSQLIVFPRQIWWIRLENLSLNDIYVAYDDEGDEFLIPAGEFLARESGATKQLLVRGSGGVAAYQMTLNFI